MSSSGIPLASRPRAGASQQEESAARQPVPPSPCLAGGAVKTLDRIIRLPELVEITGLSAATVYRLIAQGRFPRPVVLGRQARGWIASQIQAWFESLKPAESETGSGRDEAGPEPRSSEASSPRSGDPRRPRAGRPRRPAGSGRGTDDRSMNTGEGGP